MSKFIWQKDFEIGSTLIDQQHQHLFELANRVFETSDKDTMAHCALELFHYIREHFKDEEEFMRQINFPDYEHHVQAHNQILLKLEEIGLHFKTDDFNASEMYQLMAEWLLTHILKEDMSIGEFSRQTAG